MPGYEVIVGPAAERAIRNMSPADRAELAAALREDLDMAARLLTEASL